MDTDEQWTNSYSLSHSYTRNLRQIYANKLQWFRAVLGLAAAFHLTPNLGKLYWHYSTHYTPSVLPDFLSFFLSAAARLTWMFLFRDPSTFLRFKRPGRPYRWAVCGTLLLTTIPNGVVHVWALKVALRNKTVMLAGVMSASLAIVLLIPLIGLVWWMAWRFLLDVEDLDGDFEPTLKPGLVATRTGHQVASRIRSYTDNESVVAADRTITNGYLSQAYDEQSRGLEGTSESQGSVRLVTPQQDTAQDRAFEAQEQLTNGESSPLEREATSPVRCPTIARFEYMPQSHSGPHSWLSYPIIPAILGAYATFLLILVPIWIHEDRAYKLREPSSTIKKSLYFPLGIYLLCFYALKHTPHASLFERFKTAPPEPWKKLLSILPSWIGTGGTFRNLNTGEITVFDPRRRAFPQRAYYDPSVINTREYMAAYNASPGTCDTFWGHSGRRMRVDFRVSPTINRVGFIVLATYFMWTGFWNTVFYDVPNPYEEILKHPKTITPDDVRRIIRIVRIWQTLEYSGLWIFVLALVFAVASMGSMVSLFSRTIWKYVPKEEKDQIVQTLRAREEEQARREGQIRLE